MSAFIGIKCYDQNGRAGGNIHRLWRTDLEQAVRLKPNFVLVNEYGTWGIKLPGLDVIAELQGGGTLSCQLDNQTDIDHVIEQLRALALALPNAVIEDEEGETY